MYPSPLPRRHDLPHMHRTGSLSPPLVQLSATPLVMLVDDVPLPTVPTLPVLADSPVVKPTPTSIRSGLASSMHAPGNIMDTSEDPPPSLAGDTTSTVNEAQKAFEAKIEACLSSFETQLLRIAEMITGFGNKLPQSTNAPPTRGHSAPIPKNFPKEVVAEVHKL